MFFTREENRILSQQLTERSYQVTEGNERVAEMQKRTRELETQILQLEQKIERLDSDLTEVDALISDLIADGRYGNFAHDQIKSIKEIKTKTPLGLEAAAAVVYYSDYYGVDYSLILSIIDTESNFNQYLVGAASDRGYMQIIPMTEKYLVEAFGEQIGIEYNPGRIFEPDYNLGLGISYIAYLHELHGDDLDKILTEYNRGAGGLAAYYAEHDTYSSVYSRAVIDRTRKYEGIVEMNEPADAPSPTN